MATRTAKSSRPVTISRWRINTILLIAVLIISRVVIQLGNLQVIQHDTLSSDARSEIDATRTIRPERGTIRDHMGNVLALDVERESLYVNPQLVSQNQAPKLAVVLSGLLGIPSPEIQTKLQDTTRYWTPIKRWLEPEIADRINKLEEPGLQLIYEPRRYYPQGEYAAHVVGAVNLEGDGVSGVESFYNTELKGITGTVTAEWDPGGNPIWINPPKTQPASDGIDLELTIDPLVQHVIESELKKTVDRFNAAGGTVVVIEPKTGAIRGMASYPTYDPNKYYNYDEAMYNQNPVAGKIYEPGSTFKVVTVASGLQTRAFTADTQVNDTGFVQRAEDCCRNWNGGGHGMIDPSQVLLYSSNVGALLLNEKTGADNFYKMVRAFGYGQPTGVDIAGENTGIVNEPTSPGWEPLILDTNAYGQGIAVTPLQQARMMAAIGNDGKLMRPYLVQKRCRGNECEETQPQQVGQPIEPGVAWTVRHMLIGAANSYAGAIVWGPRTGDYNPNWMVPGYEVSAKTGTSDIPDGNGGYKGSVIGSVLGLAPTDDARYAILVKIDEPSGDAYGLVSAVPAYQAIADQLLRYARVTPNPNMVGPGQVIGAMVSGQ